MVLFVRQTGREKEAKNELKKKKIKECMQLRKVGMHEVVKDKAMENGLQDMDDQYALNE
jgi:hypothetical protein